jgi:hypothetical protein
MTVSDYDESIRSREPGPQEAGTPASSVTQESPSGFIGWGVASIIFVGYLIFGSIDIVQPRWNIFAQRVEDVGGSESLLHIWTFQAGHLPSIGSELIVQILFVSAACVFVAGVIAGLGVLLLSPGTTDDLVPDAIDAA